MCWWLAAVVAVVPTEVAVERVLLFPQLACFCQQVP
jgi:hypothetical protein